MDGNHSQLAAVFHLTHCADSQAPLIINIILGLPANMCVMWLILAGPGDKVAKIFSLNQAICEVAISTANVILLIGMNTAISNVAQITYWYAFRFVLGFLFSGRPLFLSCVCFERYLAVVHPVTFLKCKLLRYRLAGTLISWLTVLVCCTILTWVPYPAIYYVTFGMASTWFPVLLFCCVEALCALVRPGPGDRNQERDQMNSAKVKAFKTITFTILSVVLTYIPFIISILLLSHSSKDTSRLFCIATYTIVVTGFFPPFLYIYRAGKLKHCFKDTT